MWIRALGTGGPPLEFLLSSNALRTVTRAVISRGTSPCEHNPHILRTPAGRKSLSLNDQAFAEMFRQFQQTGLPEPRVGFMPVKSPLWALQARADMIPMRPILLRTGLSACEKPGHNPGSEESSAFFREEYVSRPLSGWFYRETEHIESIRGAGPKETMPRTGRQRHMKVFFVVIAK